ncbi:GLPGLI family protein [Aureivirga sp. CE67]|uniref:GLPGLI family protein n=1 Tax=Aureivirga sp. CE67 TaxID=1788983 RepID=UPI0018CB5728|nr:GLPGLI family protein [Aureivirga sp. CE67]
MKNILLLLLFIPNIIICQSLEDGYQLNYEVEFNTEIPNIQKAHLKLNRSQTKSAFSFINNGKNIKGFTKIESAIYMEDDSEEEYDTIKSKEYNLDDVNIIYSDSPAKPRIFIQNKLEDNLIFTYLPKHGDYIIQEKLPKFHWTLTDTHKTIDNRKVYKAISFFRGRKFIAWCDLNYSLNIGPWKFNNLPGLGVEIYDETKRFVWKLTKISKSKISKHDFEVNINEFEEISLEKYVDMIYLNPQKYFDNKINSKLPRGTITTTSFNKKRNSIETLFEWEEECEE